MDAPELVFAFEARVEIGPPLEVGRTRDGLRRVIPITGGTVKGPRLEGRVLPGGADRQVVHDDGLVELVAAYTLELSDGTVVGITNAGIVERSRGYFRTAPSFDAAEGPHGWLARSLFVGVGRLDPPAVVIRFFEVR